MAHVQSMRANYESQGVEAYYSEHGSSYRNPHDAAVNRARHVALDKWLVANHGIRFTRVLDLACGSGEATIALQEWLTKQGVGYRGGEEAQCAASEEVVQSSCMPTPQP